MSPAHRLVVPLQIICDPEDEPLVRSSGWSLSDKKSGYPCRRRNGKKEYLHHLIAGVRPGFEIDHKNGNRLDVRRDNLRHVTHAQNGRNLQARNKRNKSGYRGVSWQSLVGRWEANVQIDGKRHRLGYFDSPAEAGEAARVFRLTHADGALS